MNLENTILLKTCCNLSTALWLRNWHNFFDESCSAIMKAMSSVSGSMVVERIKDPFFMQKVLLATTGFFQLDKSVSG